jgi:hypothetical protein
MAIKYIFWAQIVRLGADTYSADKLFSNVDKVFYLTSIQDVITQLVVLAD